VIGWGHKRGPTVIAADDQQSRRDIGSVLAPEEVHISFEDRPQADARPEPAVIEQEGRARDPVCADDAVGCRQSPAKCLAIDWIEAVFFC
jgi:hypothetical protein